jgi:hypothetical protein
MNRVISALIVLVLLTFLAMVAGCSGSASNSPGQTAGPNTNVATSQLANTSAASGLLRNENWLVGTWVADVPKTSSSNFAGKKINLSVAGDMLVSNETIQGRPTGKFSYSGNLVWDVGGMARTLVFTKEDWKTGDASLMWEYASPGADQFMENITMRIYDLTFAFELDWGPQISKPGSTYKSLGFYGSIQNLDTSAKDNFDPNNMITFKQTSSTAPTMASVQPTNTSAASSPTKTATTTSATSPPKTTSTIPGTGDIWSDIPVYPGAQEAEDQSFAMSIAGDPSYPQLEWHFYSSTDDLSKVVDYYKKQMPANGWTKMMWADMGEMSYGSFQKNKEARLALIYVIQSEGGTAINIQSSGR